MTNNKSLCAMDFPKPEKLRITFDDLPLAEAIRQLFDTENYIKSEATLISDAGREWTLQKIISLLPHELSGKYSFERILLLVNQFRKLNEEHRRKRILILDHARNLTKSQCFYSGKLSTPCSDEVDLDRIKPGKRGGIYTIENTVLSCSKHNRSRGCMEVEVFWRQ